MKKAMTIGIATLLSLAFATPTLAKGPPSTGSHGAGASTHTTNATSTTGVHMAAGVHGKKVAKKTLQGVVKTISADSFVLTVHNTDYTVTPTASARVVNRVWKKISLSDIKAGDKVRVVGAVTDASIAAEIVRDISIPAQPKASGHATTIPTH